LEDNLQRLSYTLQPFSKEEQFEFLKKFWLQNLNPDDKDQARLQNYAEALIRKLAQSISDKDREFTGIPLQTRMLAEAFEVDFGSEPVLPKQLNLLGLYGRFIERKFDIYYREKSKSRADNVGAEEQRERDLKNIKLEHQRLALQMLFTDDEMTFLENCHSSFSDEQLARIGIARKNSKGKPQFIHRTFAEYFVAEFLINELRKKTKQHTRVKEILLNVILLEPFYQVLQSFLDSLLENSKPSKETLKEYGEMINEQWKEGEGYKSLTFALTALHTAAAGDNAHIIGFLLDCLKSGEYSKTLEKTLFAEDILGRTALHVAVEANSEKALKKIREWAEEVKANFVNSLHQSQNEDSNTDGQLAAERGQIKAVERAQTNPEGLQIKLLLGEDSEGRTAWHLAAQRGSVELTDKLWGWAKEELPDTDLLMNKLLLSRDMHGVNAWHLAAKAGSVEILRKLWDWAKELQVETEKIRNGVLLSQDKFGQTAWHKAAEGGHIDVFERMWDWAKEEKLNPADLKSSLFLSEDSRGFSTWRCAVCNGNIHVLEKLWIWGEELQLTTAQLNKLLVAVDRNGNSAINWAAGTGRIELLEKLWTVCKERQMKPDDLSKFLVAAWHEAAARGYLDLLERLWLWAGEVQGNPHELQRRLLLE
jgi:ankyrin repeat protein